MAPAPAYRVPPPVPVPIFTWTGCYLGGTVGGVWGSSNDSWAANPASGFTPAGAAAINSQTASTINNSGVIGGVEGGCNYQVSSWLVIGVEGDWQGTKGTPEEKLAACRDRGLRTGRPAGGRRGCGRAGGGADDLVPSGERPSAIVPAGRRDRDRADARSRPRCHSLQPC
jgi:hypothetical protein